MTEPMSGLRARQEIAERIERASRRRVAARVKAARKARRAGWPVS